MRRVAVLFVVLLAGCARDGNGDTTIAGAPTTAAAAAATPAGPCALKPLTVASERWEGSSAAPPGEGGVLWEQVFTFSNPNPVPVRLGGIVVHLRLAGSEGYFLKFARSAARAVPDETIPAERDQQRVAHVWLAPGNRPATEDLYTTASATAGGGECPVRVERLSTSPVPAHVLALQSCEPVPANTPC